VFGVLLDALLDLMNSEYGFIGEVKYEEDGTIFLQTKSRKFYEDNVANGLKFYNMNSLFGKCIMAKQVVISNDPKTDSRACGIPSGHPPLNHFLGKKLSSVSCPSGRCRTFDVSSRFVPSKAFRSLITGARTWWACWRSPTSRGDTLKKT
jgi:GAF domain